MTAIYVYLSIYLSIYLIRCTLIWGLVAGADPSIRGREGGANINVMY